VIVDAHQHFWDPAAADYPWLTEDMAALRRRFGPEELAGELHANGVDATVVVQARGAIEETRALLALAAETPFVAGVVGWVDLRGDVAAQLAALDGPLVGVRHQVHDERDPAWLLRDDVQHGLAALGEAALAFDLLVREAELPAAAEAARRHPDVRFVLDHVAKRPAADATWRERTAALAELPNVSCKLSGLFTEHDPRGTAELALEWFGAERCLFGSDWPVSLLRATYAETLELVRNVVPAEAREAVLGGNAVRIYRLPVPTTGAGRPATSSG
jgi:L-fuconolactonase